jgi:programmed cell death 8 (apoptosis-inducing factor)
LSQKGFQHVVILGGGFLGSELAFALAHRAKSLNKELKITQILRGSGNLDSALPRYLSRWITSKLSEKGVTLIPNTLVKHIREHTADSEKVLLVLDNGQEMVADKILMALGIEPNVELAKQSGLEVDELIGGIRVNSELEAAKDVFVVSKKVFLSGNYLTSYLASSRLATFVVMKILFWEDAV